MIKIRWWIADQLNRLPSQCWAGLVTWALGWPGRRWPWQSIGPACRRDCRDNGACWCGKLREDQP